MLRAYVRKWREQLRGLTEIRHAPSREWLVSSFRDFVPTAGSRDAMLSAMSLRARHIAAAFDAFLCGEDTGAGFADALVQGSAAIDDGSIRHKDHPLRAYVDVFVQVRFLRAIVEYLADLSTESMPMDAAEVTSVVVEHHPANRATLLVYAELLLDRSDVDDAIEVIRRALRIDSVCTTAQQLLFRAYRLKPDAASNAPELAALDYDLRDKFCRLPFTHLSTGFQGQSFPCQCPSWLPYSIGNVLEAESVDAIWNSDAAIEVRRSILDGDYSYCSRTLCSFIVARKLPEKDSITDPLLRRYIDTHTTRLDEVPDFVGLNHDPTCNLACPSCRTEVIVSKADEQDVYARAAERVILPLLRKVNGYAYITGGGEAFASEHFRSILKALNRAEYPGLHLVLITNGTVLTPLRWQEFPNLPEMIGILQVSLDAARKETYEKLRRPARWEIVTRNLAHIASMRRDGILRSLCLNFVVQAENFREMHEFLELGDRYAADYFWFQRITSYGSFDEAAFAGVDVTSESHPNHAELLEVLRHPNMQRDGIQTYMLPHLREMLATDRPATRVEREELDPRYFAIG